MKVLTIFSLAIFLMGLVTAGFGYTNVDGPMLYPDENASALNVNNTQYFQGYTPLTLYDYYKGLLETYFDGLYCKLTGCEMSGDINLNNNSLLETNYIDFETTANPTHAVGRLHWSDDAKGMEVGMQGGEVVLQIGQESLIYVKNNAGYDIANGKVVYSTGSSGNIPTIALADCDEPDTLHIMGIATEDINNNLNGYITINGIIRDIDTTGTPVGETWAEGDKLYLGSNGNMSNQHPSSSTAGVVIVARVIRAHATIGQILVTAPEAFTLGNNYNGTLRSSIINQNDSTNAGASFTAINNMGYRTSLSIFGSNHASLPNVGGIYNEGYGDTAYVTDGAKDHIWYTDPTDSHNFSALSYERMRLKGDTGYVGIGTDSPESLLHVSAVGEPGIRFTRTDLTPDQSWLYRILSNGVFTIRDVTSGHNVIAINKNVGNSRLEINPGETIFNNDGDDRDFRVGGVGEANALFVQGSSGNVGIGTDSPQNKLDVAGGVVIGSTYAGVNTAPTDGLLVEGNVGIGTASPDAELEVAGSIEATNLKISNQVDKDSFIYPQYWDTYGTDFSFNTHGAYDIDFHAQDTGEIKFITNGTQKAVIDNNGNVGIGTTSPAKKLDIIGGSNAQFRLSNTEADATNKLAYYNARHYTNAEEDITLMLASSLSSSTVVTFGGGSSGSNAATELRFRTAANTTTLAGTNRMVIDSSGNVGIGTDSPQNKLDVAGGVVIGSTYAGVNTAPTDGLLVEGNVGIGTASPAGEIHAKGNYANLILESTVGADNFFKFTNGANSIFGVGSGSFNIGTLTDMADTGLNNKIFSLDSANGNTYLGGIDVINNPKVFINGSTGYVGIGTDEPDAVLHIKAVSGIMHFDASSSALIKLDKGAANKQGAFEFSIQDAQKWTMGTADSDYYGAGGGDEFYISQNVAQPPAFFIDRSNNVGIGTDSPTQKLDVNGSINQTNGNATINMIYAEMYIDEDDESVVGFAAQDVYVNVTTNQSNSHTNGFNFVDGKFITQSAGMYKVDASISFSGQTGSTHGFTFGINGAKQDECYTQRKLGSGDVGALAVTCIIPLEYGNTLTLMAADEDASLNDITIVASNLNLFRVGN